MSDGNAVDSGAAYIHPVSVTVTNPTNHDADISGTPSTCAEADFVNCINGYVDGITNGPTCEDACIADGVAMCCVGTFACLGFTGKVCKDGSCSGSFACYYAYVTEVINSCKPWDGNEDGGSSCYNLNTGISRPPTVAVVDSCWGNGACSFAGYLGTIGNIENSCHGTAPPTTTSLVCRGMGQQGVVGDVINSCYGKGSCYDVGSQTTEPGITTIKDCCDGKDGTTSVLDECRLARTDAKLIAKDESCVGLPTGSPTMSVSYALSTSPVYNYFTLHITHLLTLCFFLSSHHYNILQPTSGPSRSPSKAPSKMPSVSPSKGPSVSPSSSPTAMPTGSPTKSVSYALSTSPV